MDNTDFGHLVHALSIMGAHRRQAWITRHLADDGHLMTKGQIYVLRDMWCRSLAQIERHEQALYEEQK